MEYPKFEGEKMNIYYLIYLQILNLKLYFFRRKIYKYIIFNKLKYYKIDFLNLGVIS